MYLSLLILRSCRYPLEIKAVNLSKLGSSPEPRVAQIILAFLRKPTGIETETQEGREQTLRRSKLEREALKLGMLGLMVLYGPDRN